jgi:hypothetical protein
VVVAVVLKVVEEVAAQVVVVLVHLEMVIAEHQAPLVPVVVEVEEVWHHQLVLEPTVVPVSL